MGEDKRPPADEIPAPETRLLRHDTIRSSNVTLPPGMKTVRFDEDGVSEPVSLETAIHVSANYPGYNLYIPNEADAVELHPAITPPVTDEEAAATGATGATGTEEGSEQAQTPPVQEGQTAQTAQTAQTDAASAPAASAASTPAAPARRPSGTITGKPAAGTSGTGEGA